MESNHVVPFSIWSDTKTSLTRICLSRFSTARAILWLRGPDQQMKTDMANSFSRQEESHRVRRIISQAETPRVAARGLTVFPRCAAPRRSRHERCERRAV